MYGPGEIRTHDLPLTYIKNIRRIY